MSQLTCAQPSTVQSHISRVFHTVQLYLLTFCSPLCQYKLVTVHSLIVHWTSVLKDSYLQMTKEKQFNLQEHILQALSLLIV